MIKEILFQVILMAITHTMFLLDLFLSLHFKVNVLIPGGQDVCLEASMPVLRWGGMPVRQTQIR
jgi:hypothetical protein